nr:hypothetical protein [Tanacetum cinerariifolium]
MGLPSTLDEGTRKSQPLPEGTTTDPKDSWGNIQPADKGLPSTAFNKGTIKTTLHLEGSLRDKDLGETNHLLIWNQSTLLLLILQGLVLSTRESGRDDMEEETQANEEEYQSPSPNKDKPEPSYSPTTQDSDSNSSSPDLKKFNNTLPLTKRQLIKYLRKLFRAFKGQPQPPQAMYHQQQLSLDFQQLLRDNDTHADTEEPPSHTMGEHVTIEDDKADEEPTRVVALIESSSRPPYSLIPSL